MPATRGKRKSIKKAAQRQAARQSAAARRRKDVRSAKTGPPQLGRLIIPLCITIVVVALAIIASIVGPTLYSQSDYAKYAACEKYRPTVARACVDCGLDASWTDCILAAMFVESGGDEHVPSVLGVEADIMQAAEGAYGWVVTDGWPDMGISAETTTASIYAGVLEFKQNLELWEGYLGPITPDDTTEIQLVIQGYNFGADGWLAWCRSRGVRAYTVDLAQEYSDTKMPSGAKGTPAHAQKWLVAYDVIRKNQG